MCEPTTPPKRLLNIATPGELPTAPWGVVVGRFQVAELHDAHRALLDTVFYRHRHVIICLGVSSARASWRNPLDFETRRLMLNQAGYGGAVVLPIHDCSSDTVWSQRLDALIGDITDKAVLYGSRDSFLGHYNGRHPKIELTPYNNQSGTDARADITIGASADFRRGVIWAAGHRYPTCYAAVDIAVVKPTSPDAVYPDFQVLLARKPNMSGWMFPGGFAEPGDDTKEDAGFLDDARRELHEECGGLEVSDWRWVGSCTIPDWRYRSERDKIKTNLFICRYMYGTPKPSDDLAGGELRWFGMRDLRANLMYNQIIRSSHHQLFDKLHSYLQYLK